MLKWRITERLRWEGTSGGHQVQPPPPPQLKQDHLELWAQGCVQLAFECLQKWTFPWPLWATCEGMLCFS